MKILEREFFSLNEYFLVISNYTFLHTEILQFNLKKCHKSLQCQPHVRIRRTSILVLKQCQSKLTCSLPPSLYDTVKKYYQSHFILIRSSTMYIRLQCGKSCKKFLSINFHLIQGQELQEGPFEGYLTALTHLVRSSFDLDNRKKNCFKIYQTNRTYPKTIADILLLNLFLQTYLWIIFYPYFKIFSQKRLSLQILQAR